MDLSKAFDTLNYDLLIAKLHAYSFDIRTLKLLHSYLTKKVSKNKSKSKSQYMVRAGSVPQGSALGAILFDIY